jgi:putative membrane protein
MKAFTFVVISMAATGLLVGCAATQRAMPSTMSNANVLSLFNTIDNSQIEAAQLAQLKASAPAVRDHADRIMDEHQAMLDKRRELASRMDLRPETPQLATSLKETHQEAMEELQKQSGENFDRAYLEYQIKMHEQAIEMAKETGESVDDPRLKRHLMEAQPDLQNHLAVAKNVQRQVVAQQPQEP